jgi:hypothetical protein
MAFGSGHRNHLPLVMQPFNFVHCPEGQRQVLLAEERGKKTFGLQPLHGEIAEVIPA